MHNLVGIKILGAASPFGVLDFIRGLMDIIWMILQLIWSIVAALIGLGQLTPGDIIESAHTISAGITGWISGILLMSPFSSEILNAQGVENASSEDGAYWGIITAFTRTGAGSIPILCIEAGLALTMIVFFYGFAESTVQLEKTNIQLIFSRILRWVIAVGLVSTSYLLFSYLFRAFRSLYSLGSSVDPYSSATAGTAVFYDGSLSIIEWFKNQLIKIRPSTSWYKDTTEPIWHFEDFISMDPSQSVDVGAVAAGASPFRLQNGPIGFLILLFGLIKVFKKAIKFVVEQFTAFARLLVYFVCAPLGLAMYAAPETQQKANSFMRQFAGATLTNLFKVFAIALATVLVTTITIDVGSLTGNGGGTYYILDVMGIANDLLKGAVYVGSTSTLDTASLQDLAFLVTSGGLLTYHLYFDLIGKASEVAERFAQEVMS